MNFPAAFATTAWLAASAPAYARFQRALAAPQAAQATILRRYLEQNAATAYGRVHAFDQIHSYVEFARRVPVVAYDALEPWITRIQRGERGVLTQDPVTRLLPTSGSTSARKLIPFTATLQHEFNAAIGPWMLDLARQHPSIACGPAYWSITPPGDIPDEESAVPIGFANDSDYLGGVRTRFIEAGMAVPSAVRHITGMEEFRYVVLLCLLRCGDLRLISVWHPSFLALLLDTLPRHWPDLLVDLEKGTLRCAGSLPAAVRTALTFPPDPKRATQLRRFDPARADLLWPALKVVSCWTDGHAASGAGTLQSRLPGVSIQPKGLLATEAFVTLPFAQAHPVALCSHFFEFRDDCGVIHPTEALRLGENYEVIVTTGGGLWRYLLGDRVEVTGFVGPTPSLRFLGRAGNISDRCGEKLSEAFVAQAIRAACGDDLPKFTLLAPERAEAGWRYTLYIEGVITTDLALQLDRRLRANPHYALCRDLGQLGPAAVCEVAHGYEIFAAAETARGLRLGDVKPTALSSQMNWSARFNPSGVPFLR